MSDSNLTSETTRRIEKLIETGEVRSGDRLTERSLMERFSVSRSTAREVLRKLESAGLLEIHVNRGAHVRKHSMKDVLEIFDLRCELTGYAARIVADGDHAETLKTLERLHIAMEEAVTAGDTKTYYCQNIAFHEALLAGSGNRRAATFYAQLVRETHLYRFRQIAGSAGLRRSHGEHAALLEAIRAGNPTIAEQRARKHVMGGKMRYIASFGDTRS